MTAQSVTLFRKKHPIANQLHLTLIFENLSSGQRAPRKGDIGDIILRCDAFSDAYFESLQSESAADPETQDAFERDEDMDGELFTSSRLEEIARTAQRRKGNPMDVTVDIDYDPDALYVELKNNNADLHIGGTGDCLEYRAGFLKSGKTSFSATLRLGQMPLFTRKFNFEIKRSEEEVQEAREAHENRKEVRARRACFHLVQ